jgi:hypothetical protein
MINSLDRALIASKEWEAWCQYLRGLRHPALVYSFTSGYTELIYWQLVANLSPATYADWPELRSRYQYHPTSNPIFACLSDEQRAALAVPL